MIGKEELKKKIKSFNNYVLCFILFYFGVSASALFKKISVGKEKTGWKEWDVEQGLESMEELF